MRAEPRTHGRLSLLGPERQIAGTLTWWPSPPLPARRAGHGGQGSACGGILDTRVMLRLGWRGSRPRAPSQGLPPSRALLTGSGGPAWPLGAWSLGLEPGFPPGWGLLLATPTCRSGWPQDGFSRFIPVGIEQAPRRACCCTQLKIFGRLCCPPLPSHGSLGSVAAGPESLLLHHPRIRERKPRGSCGRALGALSLWRLQGPAPEPRPRSQPKEGPGCGGQPPVSWTQCPGQALTCPRLLQPEPATGPGSPHPSRDGISHSTTPGSRRAPGHLHLELPK